MPPSRKIAFFMQDFAGGGVEKMRIALAGALAASGHEILLIVADASGPLKDRVPGIVRVIDLKCRRTGASTLRLRHVVRREQPDVLISSLDHNNIAALIACLGLGLRVLICQHNALSQEACLGWRYRIVPLLYWMLRARADAIIAVSDGVADDLANTACLGRDTITVIPNPAVDPGCLPRATAPPPHPWLAPGNLPAFVFAGRLVAQKNPELLLEAFALYRARFPARLIILGDGALREALARRAASLHLQDCIAFLGYVADPLPYVAKAAALLLTSRYEGFGNVIAEALACGTPVVATDCPHGPSEILANGAFGRLAPAGDAQAFAVAMEGDLRAHFPAPVLRARGLQYTVEACAQLHAGLIERLLRTPPRRLFGLPLSACSAGAIVQDLLNVAPEKCRLVVTPNLNHVRLLRRRDFLDACRNADIVCADGWPVALYAYLRGARRAGRVTGCDILHRLLRHPLMPGCRVAVVAESAATAARLRDWVAERGLGGSWHIEIAPRALAQNPAAQAALAAAITAVSPQLLIMTLGAPVSEVFVHTHAAALPPLWAICVGQALRVELGLVRRAPPRWRRMGAEWAWRCLQEPARLPVRYLLDGVWFPIAVVIDLARLRRGSRVQ